MSSDKVHATGAGEPPGAAGIQAGKSLPPWDQPGRFRLDCEADRGELLYRCAIIALCCYYGIFALLLWLLLRYTLPL